MPTQDLDAQCAAAMARINASINRSAGQHLRAMRTAWAFNHQFAVQQPPQPRRTTPMQPTPGA